MRIAILKEQAAGESRVAATPETVKKFIALGATLAVYADIAIAADSAVIGDPHVKVGLVAGDGGVVADIIDVELICLELLKLLMDLFPGPS